MKDSISILLILILLIALHNKVYTQISPGKLSLSHSHLEGISNCTQCHDLGNKVPDTKCLNCHDEIQTLISADRGYHASREVLEKDCVSCHSDHHGIKFDMTRFDEDRFDHLLTGYELEGTHKIAECRSCHSPDNIKDPEINKRKNTFLGLSVDCASCHNDYHQTTLGNDCASCHDVNSFRPAPFFDHEESQFKLEGAHQTLDCKECHALTTKNNVEFQEFTGIEFNSCTACHTDEHNGKLPGSCVQCHTASGFENFIGYNGFNHNLTAFKLNGQHRNTGCFDCHTFKANPRTIFQDQNGKQEENCVSCHEDIHEGKFSNNCVQCHIEESFNNIRETANFDHGMTDYPLEGKHEIVDCKSCHIDDFLSEIPFSSCIDCHDDYHEGEFVKENVQWDCIECHTVQEAFSYTTFGPEEHDSTEFPLNGAHLATPCFTCHLQEEEKWHFSDLGNTCIECHDNIHKGDLAEEYLIDNDCTNCHNSEAWNLIAFDHSVTDWKLEGAHTTVECRSCHLDEAKNNIDFNIQSLSSVPECSQCHYDVHNNQFTINNQSRCSDCHIPEDWDPVGFNHNNSSFPLDGAHAEIACIKCHNVKENEAGLQYKEYKITQYECIDCHL